jgi:hypothetical protein
MVRDSLNAFGLDIIIYEERDGHKSVASVDPVSGGLVFHEHKNGAQVIPTIQISRETVKEIIIAAAKIDIRTEEESTVRGRHEAQTAHMIDLQNIIGWFMNGQKPVKPIKLPGGGEFYQLPFGVRLDKTVK